MNQYSSAEYILECIEGKMPVTIFLMNGFQMHGTIIGFDGKSIKFRSEGRDKMIFVHAISTVAPGV